MLVGWHAFDSELWVVSIFIHDTHVTDFLKCIS